MQAANASLQRSFESLVPGHERIGRGELLTVENSSGTLPFGVCEDLAGFEFRELCDGPRSQN